MKEAWWLVDQLVQQGVHRFCLAPGSRSAPLAMAAKKHDGVKTIVHFDERGLGFYALGYAMGAKEPVALIVTSGTAVAALLPSIIEAHLSSIPLIVLTADRPPELLQTGANQTIDQVKIFGGFVTFEAQVPMGLEENYYRSIAANAHFQATLFKKPVHLNCQYREPLYGETIVYNKGTFIPHFFPKFEAKPFHTKAKKGVILLGKVEDPRPVLELAKRLKWPVLADILSNARCYAFEELIVHFDWILGKKEVENPDLILHFGDRLTSKRALEWTKGKPVVHISEKPSLQDPLRQNPTRVFSDIGPFSQEFSGEKDPDWLKLWKSLDQEASEMISACFAAYPFTEAHAALALSDLLPQGSAIFLGNSMPIRDADRFLFPKSPFGFFANRGASGIDGNIATIAGLSDGLGRPIFGLIGDQTALYDLNSMPLLRGRKIVLCISNNFGGGIFSHFPAQNFESFEEIFAASHPFCFKKAAEMFGLPYFSKEPFVDSLPESGIVEFFTNRSGNYLFQKALHSFSKPHLQEQTKS